MGFRRLESHLTECSEAECSCDQDRVRGRRIEPRRCEFAGVLLEESGVQVAGTERRMVQYAHEIVRVRVHAEQSHVIKRGDRAIDRLRAIGPVGDEFGQPGSVDPDSRRMMRFGTALSALEQASLTNLKKLGTVRAAHSALRRFSR